MYEHLASFLGGPPNPYHLSLYSKWAKNGWGIIITGNVQVCPAHLTLGRDVVLPKYVSEETLFPFRSLANVIHSNSSPHTLKSHTGSEVDGSLSTLAIMQLSHAGRQSANFIGGRYPFVPPMAPSAIAIGGGTSETNFFSRLFYRALFQTPREMSSSEIDDVVRLFVKGAKVAHQSGFDGVQLHVAHGCECSILLSAFLTRLKCLTPRKYRPPFTIYVS
jgi:2,4-dienoyl-CoA reductase-like NADH-dependent reductase (Old Yellow Enzyme family)